MPGVLRGVRGVGVAGVPGRVGRALGGAGGRPVPDAAVGRGVRVRGPGDAVPGVRVGVGRAVLDVADGSGARVGRDRSAEDDGEGSGVPSSWFTNAHTPTPPRISAAVPPAIQGARRGGRR
ncbi:hypothetical protein [Streptomyces fumanus]|uniref:hypothetical protein n=1 Tax=Streptomyces fumanus TaxID=67302 RepID=UPI00341150EC